MNTPILHSELDPAEKRRRAAIKRRKEKLLLKLGFRRAANNPRHWFHEHIGAGESWPISTRKFPMKIGHGNTQQHPGVSQGQQPNA